MAYCGVAEVRNALAPGGATTGTNTAADLDDASIEDAINEASAIVDAYLEGPFDPTQDVIPGVLVFWTRDIAAYYATLTWRKSKAPAPENPVVIRYQNALAMLQSVAKGELPIMGPAAVGDQPTVINQVSQWGIPYFFAPWNFDLYGRGQDTGGWPLVYNGVALFWPGDLQSGYPY